VIQPPTETSDSKDAKHASVALRAGNGSLTAYQRHEPEKTVLYKIVSEYLETFLEEVRDHYDKPLPKYVAKELREFLKCGLLQYGFAKAVCKVCGRTILVAFSCKKRGACCSCSARRMCNGAAHLVNRPNVIATQLVRPTRNPSEAAYWDSSGATGLKYLFEMAKACVTGTRPDTDDDELHTARVKT
jgi:hypothetical protein